MYITQGYSQRLRPRLRKHLKRIWVITLTLASFFLIAFGAKLITTSRIEVFSKPIFLVGPVDNFETPASLFDNFFATKIRVFDEIKAGETLSRALTRLQISSTTAEKFSQAIGKATNLRMLLPGDGIMIESASPSVQLGTIGDIPSLASTLEPHAIELFARDENGVAYRIRAEALASNDVNTIDVRIDKPKVYKEHSLINGKVTNNIYGAIVDNGGDAQLVNSFSDIFAWQIDFYRETQEGDTYQTIVERNVSEGRFVNYGRVLAAEYVNSGKTIRAFYFESADGEISGFFDNQGHSLRNAFLKAPLKLASISSRFGARFHPVLKRMKAHNGVDYGASRGTPFMAVASGTVTNAGYTPFNGNWVRIRHMNGYETEYLHATNLAKGVRVGAHVKQGQVIGYVGKTGLATGYHLHFGMKLHGKYVNPGAQKFERSVGIPAKYMVEFKRSIEAMVIALNRQSYDRQQVVAINNQRDS